MTTQMQFGFSLPIQNEVYNNDDWYTPEFILEASRKAMGVKQFDLDPASSHLANEKVKAKTIFTRQDDGLCKVWNPDLYKTVWLNPPYSRGNILSFVLKFLGELGTSKGIMLCRLDSSTRWFKLMIESNYITCVCLPNRKLEFQRIYPFTTKAGNKEGNILFFRNIKPEKVKKYFDDIGYVFIKV